MPETRERPIIFSGPSVIAIQQNRKSQTRRIIRKPETYTKIRDCAYCCPYGDPGDRLWVREVWAFIDCWEPSMSRMRTEDERLRYRADTDALHPNKEDPTALWASPIFMFRKFSRLLLEITDIRVQRVQEIDEAEAQREGWAFEGLKLNQSYDPVMMDTARQWYRSEWDRINAKRGYPWDENPYVWAISFKRMPMEAPHGE